MVYFDDSLDFFNDKYLAKEQTKKRQHILKMQGTVQIILIHSFLEKYM